MKHIPSFDAVVVGGGPSGATAATELARSGASVLLLDKAGRIKPCGGAIPPRLVRDFDIAESQIAARVYGARIISPSDREVDMPIGNGYVAMVDREHFDEWLRQRAVAAGSTRIDGTFVHLERDENGNAFVCYRPQGMKKDAPIQRVRTRVVIGADGARSEVARQQLKPEHPPCVFAYHEIIETSELNNAYYDPDRCDVYYQGQHSPDFYAWVFPHGETASIGTGSANKGYALRDAVRRLRTKSGLDHSATIRCEGAPIPLKPRKRWDNGKDVVVVGDAAGVVAPASGEGIYYAMECGRMSAEAVGLFLSSGNPKELARLRQRFMKQHGRVFWVLGIMQKFWYSSDKRRERFVTMCADPDVQRLTWQAYMNKELVRADPLAHARIFIKDMAHLCGLVSARS